MPLLAAIQEMVATHAHRVFVVDERQRPVGIMTQTDVLRKLVGWQPGLSDIGEGGGGCGGEGEMVVPCGIMAAMHCNTHSMFLMLIFTYQPQHHACASRLILYGMVTTAVCCHQVTWRLTRRLTSPWRRRRTAQYQIVGWSQGRSWWRAPWA